MPWCAPVLLPKVPYFNCGCKEQCELVRFLLAVLPCAAPIGSRSYR